MKQYPKYPAPALSNLKEFASYCVGKHGDHDAFRIRQNAKEYVSVSYNRFYGHLRALGTYFIKMQSLDAKIAVLGENCYEWVVTYLAAVNSNHTIVPIDKDLEAESILGIIRKTGAAAFFFTETYADIGEYVQNAGACNLFVNMTPDTQGRQGMAHFYDLLGQGEEYLQAGDRSFDEAAVDENKACTIIYTSGTMGASKGVMLSHKNLVCNDIESVKYIQLRPYEDVILSIMPLHHAYEFESSIMGSLFYGCPVGFNDGLKNFAGNLKLFRPSVLYVVPLLAESLYKKIRDTARERGMEKKLAAAIRLSNFLLHLGIDVRRVLFRQVLEGVGGRLRLMVCGGAPLGRHISKQMREIGILLLQGYGLTECSPLVSTNRIRYYKDNTVGMVVDCCTVRIIDPETHAQCGLGREGEIQVSGDSVMLGYYSDPEATAAVFDGRWLKTGDLGYFDGDFLILTGRLKNQIILQNGKNISPEELEMMLLEHDIIKEAVVVAGSGDHVRAVIFPNEAVSAKMDRESLTRLLQDAVDRVNDRLPYYKQIAEFTVRDTAFEKTTTKKIMRYKIH